MMAQWEGLKTLDLVDLTEELECAEEKIKERQAKYFGPNFFILFPGKNLIDVIGRQL